ncbi:TRAP transporter substrate-binding protein [Salinibacillus xinjiangensis]|uniref:C4-dicarboxylate ABC transporter substrate-binding protein n=1 Tax=Salinibacillus xinjiangensis TaxID=1229268 RepID=A0A6G1X1M7_9BACI|nr:TRAP transporter substrate-binding protein DctP [Salinibacillus xinjiangensis]MRG84849.1 C4-dicarboxylate ABC transporter substrate-binding protein [Salinibacillus xinjiangensis]
MKKNIILFALLLTLTMIAACGENETTSNSSGNDNGGDDSGETFEMILSSEVPESHFKSKLMKEFAEKIEKRTDGGIKTEFFPAGQLYSDIDALQSIGTGAVHSVWPVSVQLESFNSAYGLTSLPFGLTDENMLDPEYRSNLMNILTPLVEPNGMEVAGLLRTTDALFISQNEEMKSLEDLKGMKIRMTGGKWLLEMAKQIDASAIGLPASEMSTALSQGTIDAVYSSPSGWDTILGTSVPYGYYVPGLNILTYSIVLDKEWMASLPQDYQEEIYKLIDELSANQWQESIDTDKALMEKLEEDGATIHTEAKDNIEILKEEMQPVYDAFESEFPDIYSQFQELNK